MKLETSIESTCETIYHKPYEKFWFLEGHLGKRVSFKEISDSYLAAKADIK